MKINLQNSLVCSVLALAGTFAAVAPADAAVYRGRFDPVYGAPFTSPALAWAGTLQVTVDDSCVNPGFVFLLSCSAGFSIDEATVELYKVGDPLNPDGSPVTPLQTMDFAAEAGAAISGLNWGLTFNASEELVSVFSTAFPAIKGSIAETKYLGNQAFFSLQFLGDFAQLYWFKNKPDAVELLALTNGLTGACRDNGVNVIPSIPWIGYKGNKCGWSNPDNITPGSFITFSRVPEPATYALVPAALGLMGLVGLSSRRRRTVAPQQ